MPRIGAPANNFLPNVVLTKTAAYTALVNEVILANAAGGGFTITLPSNPPVGSLVTVQKTDSSANVVVVDPTGAGTVHGAANSSLDTQWAGGVFEHQGSDVWLKIALSSIATASETVVGGAEVATQTETNTGTDDSRIVTPLKLQTKAVLINAQTGTTYTFVLADQNKWVSFNNASAITVTVPPNSSVAFPVGTQIEGVQLGAGQVTFAEGSGVTVRKVPGFKIAAQYGVYGLMKIATDEWVLYGRLSA